MKYKPDEYVIRIQHYAGGEPSMQTTFSSAMDGQGGDLAEVANRLAANVMAVHGWTPTPGYRAEIILGATINRTARMEQLMLDCRNLLIGLEGIQMGPDLSDQLELVLGAMDVELGLDQVTQKP